LALSRHTREVLVSCEHIDRVQLLLQVGVDHEGCLSQSIGRAGLHTHSMYMADMAHRTHAVHACFIGTSLLYMADMAHRTHAMHACFIGTSLLNMADMAHHTHAMHACFTGTSLPSCTRASWWKYPRRASMCLTASRTMLLSTAGSQRWPQRQ
jgi:hypothetical protein